MDNAKCPHREGCSLVAFYTAPDLSVLQVSCTTHGRNWTVSDDGEARRLIELATEHGNRRTAEARKAAEDRGKANDQASQPEAQFDHMIPGERPDQA